jgi:hypothetical protein
LGHFGNSLWIQKWLLFNGGDIFVPKGFRRNKRYLPHSGKALFISGAGML